MAAFTVLLVGPRRMVHLSSDSSIRHPSQVFSIDNDIVKSLLTVEQVSKMLSNMYVKTSGASLERLGINVEPLALDINEPSLATKNFGLTRYYHYA